MIFKPHPLSTSQLPAPELEEDRKSCRKVGPCGIGKKAIYLNSFYVDRCYYIPFTAVRRVFKRVAMSKGGFSGKGMFASIPYLVVEYDDGQQKQCNFKYENQVDDLLKMLSAIVVALFLAFPYWKGKYFTKVSNGGGNNHA